MAEQELRAAAAKTQDGEWRGPLRTLLLSRSEGKREVVLKQLQSVFESKSAEIVAEIQRHGEAKASLTWWPWLRIRPFLGYRSACASVYRTMVEHVLPAQAGSSIQVQQRETDSGGKTLRYVLRDDATEGDLADASNRSERAVAIADPASQARALLVVLRQLREASAWEVEKAAGEEVSSAEKWKARTPDLETPEYEVLFEDPSGVYEVRRYKAYSAVEMEKGQEGEAAKGGNRQFFALANYIFGKANVAQEKMAMTTPVQMDSRTGTMSFIMPSNYWGEDQLKSAPAPTAEAGVRLVARGEETLAVSIFGGYARGQAVDEKKEALLKALDGASNLRVPDKDATRLMQYNDPFTVPWKRRNEVSVPVEML